MSEHEKIAAGNARQPLSATGRGAYSFIPAAFFVCASVFLLHRAEASEEEGIVTLEERQWATRSNGPYISWPDAVTYCAELSLGSYKDWRLPTLTELESLYDPDAGGGIRSPITIEGCCLWSNTSLEELPAEDGDEVAGRPRRYRWGFMFDGGHSYYAGSYYEDGEALCTRDD